MTVTVNITLVFLILLGPVCASAEVYKWVDEEGRTHYGEKPQGNGASKMNIDANPEIDENVESQNIERDKLLKIYEEERQVKEEKKQQAEKERKELGEKCTALENQLQDYRQTGIRFYDLDNKGERVYISEEELAARIDQMQKQYDKYCR